MEKRKSAFPKFEVVYFRIKNEIVDKILDGFFEKFLTKEEQREWLFSVSISHWSEADGAKIFYDCRCWNKKGKNIDQINKNFKKLINILFENNLIDFLSWESEQ